MLVIGERGKIDFIDISEVESIRLGFGYGYGQLESSSTVSLPSFQIRRLREYQVR